MPRPESSLSPELACSQLAMSYLLALERYPEAESLAERYRLPNMPLDELSVLLEPSGPEQKARLWEMFQEQNPDLEIQEPKDLARMPPQKFLESVFRMLHAPS